MAKKKSSTQAAPSTTDRIKLMDVVPNAVMVSAAMGGLWYFDVGSVLLNAVDGYLVPWVGSLAQSTAAQLTSLAVETGLAFTAMKSTLWVGARVQAASVLEKENAALKSQLESNLAQDAASEENDDLAQREEALVAREQELAQRQTALNKKIGALKGQWTKFNKAKEEFEKSKQETAKKAHDAAKKQTDLAALEEDLNDRARALEDQKEELNQWELELESAQQQLDADRAALRGDEGLIVPVAKPESKPVSEEGEIGQARPSRFMLKDFERRRDSERRELARPLEEQQPSAEERAHHSSDELSSSRSPRRSPSPSSVH